jgi:hypothetical protein
MLQKISQQKMWFLGKGEYEILQQKYLIEQQHYNDEMVQNMMLHIQIKHMQD